MDDRFALEGTISGIASGIPRSTKTISLGMTIFFHVILNDPFGVAHSSGSGQAQDKRRERGITEGSHTKTVCFDYIASVAKQC
jgi:hypothetical protein